MNVEFFKMFEGIIVVFETIIVYLYLNGLFIKSNKNKKFIITGYLIFFLGLMTLTLFVRTGIFLTLYILIGIYVLLKKIYITNFSSRIIAVFYFAAIMMLTEMLVAGIISGIWDTSINDILEYNSKWLFGALITKLIQAIIVKITVSLVSWKTNKFEAGEYRLMLPLLLCQVALIVIAYYIAVVTNKIFGSFSVISFLSVVSIIYINIICLWYFDRVKAVLEYKSRSELAEYKLSLEKNYYQILQTHQKETDELWHDMKKHLNLMKALVATCNQNLTISYVNQLESEMNDCVKIIKTNYPILSALLTEQKRRANTSNIPFEIDVKLEDQMNIEPVDLCILLDNLFDNALEACTLMSDNLERFIKLSLKQKNGIIVLEIINSFTESSRINWHQGKTGIGTNNVKKVVEKYSGNINFSEKDALYKVLIIFP